MSKKLFSVCGFLVLPVFLVSAVPGCGGPAVPAGVEVTLPDGTTVTTTMGSGVISLADSQWDFFQGTGDPRGGAFVRVRFGADGNLESFVDNTIASEIFGSEIIFDGQRHPTAQPVLEYAAATYGAETSDSTGFTFEGRLTAFAAGFEAATATATAMAEFDEVDPDIVHGTFSFTSQVLLFAEMFPQGNIDDEFSFVGRRVIE
jgi:hypothetical protein